MSRSGWLRLGLVYLAGANALVGFWAAFAPRSFYLDFPGGSRAWISADGPYNEHLVRDVGELNLALFVVMVAAAVTLSRPLVRAALVATIVNGVVHVLYHARNLDPYGTGDQVAVIGSLVLVPIVAVVLLALTRSGPVGADAPVLVED
jgi:hypothetical protein